jgi:hypothetical protein
MGRALAAAVALALAGAAPAHASWSQPFDVSLPGWDAQAPQVAVGPSGDATAVWSRFDGTAEVVQARRIGPSGELGPILDLSVGGESALGPAVAVDPSGTATVAWRRWDGTSFVVQARRVDAAGNSGPVLDLSDPGDDAENPQVAVDGAGNATVVWSADAVAQARRIAANGTLGAILDLSDEGDEPDVAVAPGGVAVAAWRRPDVDPETIEARQIEPNGTLGPVVPLSDPAEESAGPQVAIGPAGVPVVTWGRLDGVVEARRGLAPPGPIETLSKPGEIATAPRIASDPAGNTTVVWQAADGADDFVQSRRIASDGTVEDVRDLAAASTLDSPRVAVDAGGEATVLWWTDTGAGLGVQARDVGTGGQLGTLVDVSPTGNGEDLVDPEVAVDPAGHPVAVWADWDGSNWVIAAARFVVPAAPPVPLPPSPPAGSAPPPAACATLALRRLRGHTSGQPKRRRAKGVGTRLTLSGAGRLDLISVTLAYRLRGKRRTARLRTIDFDADSAETLTFKLPRRLARRLPLGRRVTLKLRARAAAPGCGFGAARTLSVTTRLIWVRTRSSI